MKAKRKISAAILEAFISAADDEAIKRFGWCKNLFLEIGSFKIFSFEKFQNFEKCTRNL